MEAPAPGTSTTNETIVRDAFLLFNPKQPGIAAIYDALQERGVTTWVSLDVRSESEWTPVEDQALNRARSIVVIIGEHGWDDHQRKLCQRAVALDKHMIPVVIGTRWPRDFTGRGGLLERYPLVHFESPEHREAADELASAIRAAAHQQSSAEQTSESTSAPADLYTRDAFLLFNSRQPGIALINAGLREHGVTTWFSPHDVGVGDEWEAREAMALARARTVVVLLGDHGWGPMHGRLAQQAAGRSARIVPVIIGEVTDEHLAGLDGSLAPFHRHHLKSVDDREAMAKLAQQIRTLQSEPSTRLRDEASKATFPPAPRQAALLRRLIRGDEDSRAEALDELAELTKRYDFAELEDGILVHIAERIAPDDDRRIGQRAALAAALMTCCIRRDERGARWRPMTADLADHFMQEDSAATVRFAAIAAAVRANARPGRLPKDDPDATIATLLESARARQLNGRSASDPVPAFLVSPDAGARRIALRVLRVLPNVELVPEMMGCVRRSMEAGGRAGMEEASLALSALTASEVREEVARWATDPQMIEPIAFASAMASPLLIRRALDMLVRVGRATLESRLEACIPLDGGVARGAENLLEALGRITRQYVAGYVPEVTDVSEDLELSEDRLDVALDVKTLCAVMLSTDVKPPLSIGLFGNWGTGKTFFMNCMEAEVTRLSRHAHAAQEKRFHTRVAQIRFNAWHYIDANLWASLVSHIIEELSKAVQPETSALATRNSLVVQLQTAQDLKKEAQDEMVRATETRTNVERELHQVSADRAKEQVALSNLRAGDLWAAVRDDQALTKTLDDASDALGVPRALASMQELEAAVRDVHGLGARAYALVRTLARSPGRLALLLLTALAAVGAPALLWLLGKWPSNLPVIPATSAFIAQVTAGAAAVTALLRGPRQVVNQWLGKLEQAQREAHALLEQKRTERSKQEIELEKKIEELGAKVASATAQFAAAEARVREIETRINEIDDGRSLSKYLLQRFQTEDYRRHLGLVSTIRRDFEKLAELLAIAAKESKTEPIQRIVLYVDDLDRCPAPRVLEVLQAVHLLLAFELFVVVVGVDPRWLLHSLERSYSAFRRGGGGRGRRWVTTPQNYLEKIFQIPFSLRPMGEAGFGKLLGSLLPDTQPSGAMPAPASTTATPPDAAAAGTAPGSPAVPATAGTTASAPTTADAPAAEPERPAGTRPSSATAPAPAQRHEPPAPPSLNYDALRIRPWERAYAAKLHAFMPSPRAAKRFANVYRLLKAPLDHDELKRFEGSAESPGEFRIAMLLLAISTGFPSSASALFTSLLETSSASPAEPTAWLDALPRSEPPIADVPRLVRTLRPLLADATPNTIAPLAAWIPRVMRFSFDSPNEGTG